MINVKVILTHKSYGAAPRLDSSDLAKRIEELMNEGYEITHAQNDYIILMKPEGINSSTIGDTWGSVMDLER